MSPQDFIVQRRPPEEICSKKSSSEGDMNLVMYGVLKVVEYKVQILIFDENFIILTHTYYTNCVRR